MNSPSSALDHEAQAMWRAVRGEPPPEGLTGGELLDLLIRNCPDLSYDRYQSPHLRSSVLTRPRWDAP